MTDAESFLTGLLREVLPAQEPPATPYGAQVRFAEEVAAGRFPRQIVAPTAAGKTLLVLGAWAYAQSVNPSMTPRRLVWAVNRRTILAQVENDAVAVKAYIERRTPGSEMLVSRLHGGMFLDERYLLWPEKPAIIIATPDMIGSRLLFCAYGPRRRTIPSLAGVMATDAWVVIDEPHLSPAFVETAFRVLALNERPLRPFHVSVVGATVPPEILPADAGTARFEIRAEDLAGTAAEKRMSAKKRLALIDGNARKVLEAIFASQGGPKAVAAIVRRREDAAAIFRWAQKKGITVFGAIGGMRAIDRVRLLQEPEFRRVFLEGGEPTGPTLLVGTTAIAVGWNVPFPFLVTDETDFADLVQRFGRLNRAGTKPLYLLPFAGEPINAVLAIGPKRNSDEAAAQTTDFLRERANGGTLDATPTALAALNPPGTAMAPLPFTPELTRADVEFLQMTSLPVSRPDIGHLIHGLHSGGTARRVNVFWRAPLCHLRGVMAVEYLQAVRPLAGEVAQMQREELREPLVALGDLPVYVIKGEEVTEVSANALERMRLVDGAVVALPTSAAIYRPPFLCEPDVLADDSLDVYAFVRTETDRFPAFSAPHWELLALEDETMADEVIGAQEERLQATHPESRVTLLAALVMGQKLGLAYHLRPRDARPQAVTIAEHNRAVAGAVAEITAALAISPELARVLHAAADKHDLGKDHPDIQSAYQGTEHPDLIHPLAKSISSGRPPVRCRHEVRSAARVTGGDLERHLVEAHHGFARPSWPRAEHPDFAALQPTGIDSDTARRFFDFAHEFGPWGLAYVEALLRAADARISEAYP